MKKIIKLAILSSFIFQLSSLYAQPFTHADTLRGSIGPGRDWWDATKYDLHVKFNLEDSTISGKNIISFTRIKNGNNLMQIDLQEPMIIDSIFVTHPNIATGKTYGLIDNIEEKVDFKKDGNAYFIEANFISTGFHPELTIYYHGKPRIAKLAPWDGGLVYKKDKNNNPWVSIACQGLGASVWYPCKDHQSDEPDSASMHFTCPDTLTAVSNGRFSGKTNNNDGTATYNWAVISPINNYNIIPYIGKYVNFNETYKGEKGNLDMDYWVLEENLEKAKKQFIDAPRMMKAFEHWFGPYPFYEDGYKLVDAPYLGMEHQSAVAYGNGYKNGYYGKDLSGSGWGVKWDFIIVPENGHEWFANNITTKDIADMWVHEGFTDYSETLFTEYYYGKEAASEYVIGLRKNIENDKPIIGNYGVNNEGSGDMYFKAGNMIHTIRQVINNDEKFRQILRGMNKTFYHQTVTSKQVEDYISKQSNIDFSKVFDQYLRTIKIPTLEYKIDKYKLSYRWTDCVKGFNMPLKITFKTSQWIKPTGKWKTLNLYPESDNTFEVDKNFYINTKKVN
ncbi:MAG: M1 family metallopeptidase [Chitinophagaceae bacterium]|nr:M1 family metallopeptidase [Chitinophagaceae bacterium]